MRNGNVNCLFYLLVPLIMVYISSFTPACIPNVINTPLKSNQGEFRASASVGLSGFDPQISYAQTDNTGIMLNGSFADRTSDSTHDFHQHQFIEAGLGYYQKISTGGRFETYGGAGFGRLKTEYDNKLWMSHADVNSMRLFIQQVIGASIDVSDSSFAARFVVLTS